MRIKSIVMFFMIEYFKASYIHFYIYSNFSSDVLCGLLQCLGGAYQNVYRLTGSFTTVSANGEFCRYFANLRQSARNASLNKLNDAY